MPSRPRRRVVGGALLREGRVLLGHRHPSRTHFPGVWDVPGGHIEPGESPQAALERELREELGVVVDLGGRDPEFRLVNADYELSLWLLPAWQGDVANLAPDEHDALGWFAGDEVGSLELADPNYLRVLSAALAAGKAQLQWSKDGKSVTKSSRPAAARLP